MEDIIWTRKIYKNIIEEPYISLEKIVVIKGVSFISIEIKMLSSLNYDFNIMHSLIHSYTNGFKDRIPKCGYTFLNLSSNGSNTGLRLLLAAKDLIKDTNKLCREISEEFSIISRLILNYKEIPNLNIVDCSNISNHIDIESLKSIVSNFTQRLKILSIEDN